MKNTSDTAFIIGMLCFILAQETGERAISWCGAVWIIISIVRMLTETHKGWVNNANTPGKKSPN